MAIVLYPDPVLRRRAEEVDPNRPDLRDLAQAMLQTMRDAAGIGLAAPQVGLSVRLFVAGGTGQPEDALVCINPRLEISGPLVELEEGCLSLPEIRAVIKRPAKVRLRAWNLEGVEFEREAEGLLARIL
ncbi:MAG: peptide deformylase, partial [Planctomycetota bacterium]